MKTTGLLDTVKGATVKIHANDCGMLQTAGKRFRRVEWDEDAERDLVEREFKIVRCRCCK
jgi:hypothetical protein